MKDAITIIKADHRAVEKLFKEYEALGDKAYKTKEQIAGQILNLLSVHADMEEEIYYSKLKPRFDKEDDKMVDEANVEHGVAKELMSAIESMDPEDVLYDAKVKVLAEVVAHHVKEEENELIPATMKVFSEEELIEMGQEMEVYKAENLEQ